MKDQVMKFLVGVGVALVVAGIMGCGLGQGTQRDILLAALLGGEVTNGVNCWEIEGEQDTNGDGVVDVLDCRGDRGVSGVAGEDGRDGEPGADGADGADGLDGAQGPSGPRGPAGPPGADGEDGARGCIAAVIEVCHCGPVRSGRGRNPEVFCQTKKIDCHALDAHLGHGDELGACD